MRLEPAVSQAEIEAYRAELARKRVAVIGAGRSGMACTRLLAGLGAHVVVADVKPLEELWAEAEGTLARGAALIPEFTRLEQLPEVSLLVASPGVPSDHPALTEARAQGIEVIGTLELACRLCPGPIVAVTGTNGKGTCCRLLADMLERGGVPRLLAGNIGLPLAAEVGDADPATVVVVEVSSFQLETIARFRPRVAVLLNVAPDHLDRHASLSEYLAAKSRIFERQGAHDFAVVNLDDPTAAEMARSSRAWLLGLSLRDDAAAGHPDGGRLVVALGGEAEEICPAGDFPLRGDHHITNVLAAAVVARLLEVERNQIAAAVRDYQPPAHHMELVAEMSGVRFMNDSKASNPSAALADLAALDRPFIAIVGGKDKGADFSGLGRLLAENAKRVMLIGEAAGRIGAAMGEQGAAEPAESLEIAVSRAGELAEAGDVVILAPGCASFDMFRDFAHRGEAFRQAVGTLAQSEGA